MKVKQTIEVLEALVNGEWTQDPIKIKEILNEKGVTIITRTGNSIQTNLDITDTLQNQSVRVAGEFFGLIKK